MSRSGTDAQKAVRIWRNNTRAMIRCPFFRQISSSVSITCESPVKPGAKDVSNQTSFQRARDLQGWVESCCLSFRPGECCPIAEALCRYYAGEDTPRAGK